MQWSAATLSAHSIHHLSVRAFHLSRLAVGARIEPSISSSAAIMSCFAYHFFKYIHSFHIIHSFRCLSVGGCRAWHIRCVKCEYDSLHVVLLLFFSKLSWCRIIACTQSSIGSRRIHADRLIEQFYRSKTPTTKNVQIIKVFLFEIVLFFVLVRGSTDRIAGQEYTKSFSVTVHRSSFVHPSVWTHKTWKQSFCLLHCDWLMFFWPKVINKSFRK